MLSKEKKVQPTFKSGNDAKPIVIRSVCTCRNFTLEEIFYLSMNVDKCPRCGLQTEV